MITPQFEVTQDNDFVYVNIRAPHIKASMIQFEVSEEVFVFTLPPYFLRLRFPGKVVEDDRMTSSYDLKSSTVRCKVAKLIPGEEFEDLDMLSKLLATRKQQNGNASDAISKPLIQELDSNPEEIMKQMQDPDFDWEVTQEIYTEDKETCKYGFNNQYSEKVGLSMHTGNEINELADPEHEKADVKLRLLRETTAEQFNKDHYLADLYDDEIIRELLHFSFPTSLQLTSDLNDRILKLGCREFLVSNQKSTYLGIIPLVFGWAYDYRSNLGDTSVESSWTVGKLAPSMCFLFNSYHSVGDVVKDCTARSLVRPLYRNWNLTLQVWQDTLHVFQGQKQQILAVFARLLEIFENDLHLVYRQIIVEDYTIWIQYASNAVIESMCVELKKAITSLTKKDTYLPILETEAEILNSEEDSDDESLDE